MNKIISPLRPDMRGAVVADLQEALRLLLDRGAILRDDEGARRELSADLEREQSTQAYGHATRKLVSIFQEERRLQLRGDRGEVDEPTAQALNDLLREWGLLDQPAEPDRAQYQVEGQVFSRISTGVGGLRVVIVDKGVGGEVALEETETDEAGAYRVTFPDSDMRRRGKLQPDLEARVYAGDVFLGASDVRYNASRAVVLNVLLPDGAASVLRSEYEVLSSALARNFDGTLGDLKETGEQQDITYLANKTGWDARAVALAALADQFSARTLNADGVPAIPQGFFYALFRAGLPADDAALYGTEAAGVEAIWKQGIAQGIIPAQLEASLPAALDQFRTLSARRALDGPALGGSSSLGEMLKVSLPDASIEQREQFARLKVQHQGHPIQFWDDVKSTFGGPAARRLRLDGQLAYLTLNNAPLIGRLHADAGETPLSAPGDLIARGFYRAEKWQALIGEDRVPPEVPGDGEPARRANYAEALATQLRLSYPTATLAAMVTSGETPTVFAAADKVHTFLLQHQDRFQIGMQPVEQFVTRNQILIEPEVQREITRIQRVRQITPSDAAMNALLRHGVDSAYAVARYDRDEFVVTFKDELGGEAQATLIHAKAQQVHSAVLNIAISYLLASNAPGIGVHSPAQVINPPPDVPDNAGDVIAYASLEKLLGEMDYCECDHCRSILSPAAYLVDLLQFLDRDAERWSQYRSQWRKTHDNVPYPYTFTKLQDWIDAGSPAETVLTPLEVLLSRRPDLQHLPLTCENTNTPLPYIDLVNETLEHFVANGLKLQDYRGHSTDDHATAEELLANPQFVQDTAYAILAGGGNPAPLLPPTPQLPLHQPLERLRRLFGAFDAPLPRVMEAFRKTNSLERANDAGYGWRDIWMEELRLSRAEHALLSDRTLTLQQLYGFPPATPEAAVLTALSNAKAFTRRLDISYEDLIEILRTRFVNPHGALIPKLERLRVPLKTIKDFKDGVITQQQFEDALAHQVDEAQYGGDIKAWVTKQANYDKIMSLLLLADPTGANDPGSFDRLEFRYADPAKLANKIRPFEFVRMLRFIRLWKKLGWSVDQTDKAIVALYPSDQTLDDVDDTVNLQRLDAGFLVLLPRLGVVTRVMDRLSLKLKNDFLPLLACFALMDTYGDRSLYRKLFLNPSLLKQDPVFSDNGVGDVLNGSEKLLAHSEVLRAALTLSADEFSRICEALGYDANTPLTIDSVSAVFRRGWLARKLKLSVQELLLLAHYSGMDPFAAIDPVDSQVLAFIEFVNHLRATELKPSQALYLIWNQDINGTSNPDAGQVNEFARSLRAGLAAIETEFAVADDPDGQIARARMALVYDNATTDMFFGMLNNTLVSDVSYSHGDNQTTLEQPILDVAPGQISYDDFRKRLAFAGVMTTDVRDSLKNIPSASNDFKVAVETLYGENQQITAAFFGGYPELQPLYDAYVASKGSLAEKRAALLDHFLPTLKQRRKRQQALQAISAAAKVDTAFAEVTLGVASVLHAASAPNQPALEDLPALARFGPSVQFFFRDSATGNVDDSEDATGPLDYAATGKHRLPGNGGNPLSGVWKGYIEAPTSDFYNIRIEADGGASVTLIVGGVEVTLTQNGNVWKNASPIELHAGALHAFTLKAERVRSVLNVRWQTTGRGWEITPERYLYSATLCDYLYLTYTRFFKAASLASALKLTADEMAHLGSGADYQIDGNGWLNSLPVGGSPKQATARALHKSLGALLGFARLKAALSSDDQRLLAVIKNPQAATTKPRGLLYVLTRWEPSSLEALLTNFGKTNADLAHLDTLQRTFDAYGWLTALGTSATAMIAATTNEPSADIPRQLQAALRARYAESDWLPLIRPINDDLRSLQRDALVAYILHQMRSNPTSEHIDTAEKLFEYFLMDVQMAPCMQTSRIRHALSSVQLFIERCLMNLEPRVAASAIKAKQWEWMRRYRVWEANRKIFLWPENWLEPELRDDQSPFFKELMSDLLQGDITEDRAAAALGDYLGKLNEVAKLEPCGIHFVENDPGAADDVTHVVARTTTGANRKYYYRRREGGSWTPWDPIKLDIEDNPVIPVVWKNRLFLFWLRILKQAVPAEPLKLADGKDKDLTALNTAEIKKEPPQSTVQALLCWSEYFNRQWQPVRTSDVDKPVTLGTKKLIGNYTFDRTALTLSVDEETLNLEGGGTVLRIWIYGDGMGGSFVFVNTHSSPLRAADFGKIGSSVVSGRGRRIYVDEKQLIFKYYDSYNFGGSEDHKRIALTSWRDGRTSQPCNLLRDSWDAPFFFEDTRHVFYVKTERQTVDVDQWKEYGIVPHQPEFKIPPIYSEKPKFVKPDLLGPVITDPRLKITDATSFERFVTEDAYIKRVIGVTTAVSYGDQLIGPAGQLQQKGEQI